MNTQNFISSALIRPLIEVMPAEFFESLIHEQPQLQTVLKQLREPNGFIEREAADILISRLINDSKDEALCLFNNKSTNIHNGCHLQHLFLCCNSAREALYHLEKFSTLLNNQLELQITRTREGIIKVKMPVQDNYLVSTERHLTELAISTFLGWLYQLCGAELDIIRVTLPFPATQYQQSYAKAWRTEVEFNSTECTIQFHQSWLDKGLHSTNPHILSMMKKEVEEQFKKLSSTGSLLPLLKRAYLQQRLALNASQQEVAEYFHISSRTLNRRLNREGTTLKQLVTQMRVELAKELLLQDNHSIEEIATELGLSGRRTLDRIFIKEMHMTPAHFRNTQLQERKVS